VSRRPALPGRSAVVALAAAASAYSVLQSLVVPALTTLQGALHTGPVGAAWVFTTYLLVASVLTPVIGRLGDLFGRARALTWSLVVLAAGCVVSALATSLPVMLAGRVVQGTGGAVFPLAFALVRDVVPAPRRTGAVAAVSAALTVTGSLGTVLAGVVLHVLDHHWLFWLPAGLTLAAAVAARRWLPAAPPPGGPRRVGWAAAGLLSGWLTALLLAISLVPQAGVTGVPVLGAVATDGLLAALWVRAELAAVDPLVDVRALWTPALRATNGATALLGAGMFSAWMLVPMLVQQPAGTGVGLGLPPLAVGLVMLANAAGALAVTPLVPLLARRSGARSPVVAGAALAAASYLLLAARHGTVVEVCTGLVAEGAGIGLAFAGIAALVVDGVPAGRTGVASGMNTICRTVGGAVGTTASGALLATSAAASGTGHPAPAAYTVAFAGFAAALALSALVAASGDSSWPRPRTRLRTRPRTLAGGAAGQVPTGPLTPAAPRRTRHDDPTP
jgi:MFS family permease